MAGARSSHLIPVRAALSMFCAAVMFATSLVQVADANETDPAWMRAADLFHFHNDAQVFTSGACGKTFDVEGVSIKSCGGLIDSFDGMSLSVAIRMPAEATEPLPTLLFLHGLASRRGEFSSGGLSGWNKPLGADALAAAGYAVVMPSTRGMGGSCSVHPATGPHAEEAPPKPQLETPHGPAYLGAPMDPDHTCSRGWSHLAERDYEIKDYQHLLGLMVDAAVADPDRLGVAGWEYGGGQSWLLATAQPWVTPNGSRSIALAAAVPMAGWTSFQNALTPNGRASDEPDQDRSLEQPFGVLKESIAVKLFSEGRTVGAFSTHVPRFNDVDPSETHSYTPGWFALYEEGEPYDTPESSTLAAAFRNKSAFFADDYFADLQAGSVRPVPILAVQGWNDALFPAVEALQMYRKLNATDPHYPISMVLADIGRSHGRGKGTGEVKAEWFGLVRDFLDSHLLDGVAPEHQIVSMTTECIRGPLQDFELPPVPASTREVASDWDSIHPGLLTFKSEESLTTRSGPPDYDEEAPTDPGSGHFYPGCISQPPGSYDEGVDYRWSVPAGGFSLLGLPKFMADYRLSGKDATVFAKLWDVDGTGRRTLVTRGVYRLSLAGGDEPEGKLKLSLFGNHYRFSEGHCIELEISQTDAPFFRPNDFRSTIEWQDIKLEVPTTSADVSQDDEGDADDFCREGQ